MRVLTEMSNASDDDNERGGKDLKSQILRITCTSVVKSECIVIIVLAHNALLLLKCTPELDGNA